VCRLSFHALRALPRGASDSLRANAGLRRLRRKSRSQHPLHRRQRHARRVWNTNHSNTQLTPRRAHTHKGLRWCNVVRSTRARVSHRRRRRATVLERWTREIGKLERRSADKGATRELTVLDVRLVLVLRTRRAQAQHWHWERESGARTEKPAAVPLLVNGLRSIYARQGRFTTDIVGSSAGSRRAVWIRV
jgi:hypothetical protein